MNFEQQIRNLNFIKHDHWHRDYVSGVVIYSNPLNYFEYIVTIRGKKVLFIEGQAVGFIDENNQLHEDLNF